MRKKLLVGFVLGASIIFLATTLSPLAGFVLGALVFLSTLGIGVHRYRIPIHPAKALIIRSRFDGAVRRVVSGPASTFVFPLREEIGPILDTSEQRESVYVDNLLQGRQEATVFSIEAHIMYHLAPLTVSPARLGEILPNLTGSLSTLLRFWTTCFLRKLVSGLDLAHCHSDHQRRLERRLYRLLREQLTSCGIVIQNVQLLVQAPAGLHGTLTTAEQKRVGINLEAERLRAILSALEGQSEEARILAALELANAMSLAGRIWTSVDLASLINSNNAVPDQTLSSQSSHPPQLIELMQTILESE